MISEILKKFEEEFGVLELLYRVLKDALDKPQCEGTGTYHHFVDGQCEYCEANEDYGGHA